jgi:single-strand DNA-binding protein
MLLTRFWGIYSMNKIILAGRLTRDAEIRYTSGAEQTAIARMSIAVDRRYKKDGAPSADFFNLVAFGKLADFFGQYGWKGTKFIIEGRLQSGSYEKDGKRVYTVDVVVESAEFAESKKSSEKNSENNNPAPAAGDGEFLNVPDVADNEIPFA